MVVMGFFFKQKTAYEMRISDWSSDVCSSDLCADLLDKWQDIALPNYWEIEEGNEIWARCLATAIDYFTADSVEYRLLARGIVVHHGKMPGLLARRLKTVIDRGYVRVIIATSTLSEGVNIPVNFLLKIGRAHV